jgi:hypothetical protein
MTRFFFTFFSCFLFSLAVFADGKGGDDKIGQSLFDVWNTKNHTEIELHLNFDSLEVYRKKTESLPAKVIQNGKSLDLEVTVRGRFRRRTCAMPPLKLRFKKEGLRNLGLNTHNDFKLVTHCTDDAAGQDALLREQLAYELYNTVSPAASFRTQLLTITYVNTADGSTTTSYAILIEDTDELKGRLDTKNCDACYNLPASEIANAESLALFQYLIGNNDYGTEMIRNLKLMKTATGENVFIPYDFDYSGLVNADYATGMPHLGTTQVTDRILIWNYDVPADFTAAAASLTKLKDTLLAQVADFDGLASSSKREITKYLKGGFHDIKSLNFTFAK